MSKLWVSIFHAIVIVTVWVVNFIVWAHQVPPSRVVADSPHHRKTNRNKKNQGSRAGLLISSVGRLVLRSEKSRRLTRKQGLLSSYLVNAGDMIWPVVTLSSDCAPHIRVQWRKFGTTNVHSNYFLKSFSSITQLGCKEYYVILKKILPSLVKKINIK